MTDGKNRGTLTRLALVSYRGVTGTQGMDYDPKSCNVLEKPYYRPIEAAIRWCKLVAHEAEILGAMTDRDLQPPRTRFPQWPCLFNNTDKILDAIRHGELQGGRDGVTVDDPSGVARHRLTIRHSDLKQWMLTNEPGQKPDFLFGGDAGIDTTEKPLSTTEKNTLLKLVIGMAVKGYSYDSAASKSTVPKEIADDLAELGMTVTDDTVRKYLKQAADTVLPAKPPQR